MVLFNNLFDHYFFKQWLEEKRNLSPISLHQYVSGIDHYLLTVKDPENLEECNKYIIEYAIKHHRYNVYTFIKAYIHYKITDANKRATFLDNLIVPPVPEYNVHERKYLTEDDIIKLVNNLKRPKHKLIAMLQFLTGVRAGDVIRLRRDHVVPELYEGKNVIKLIIMGKGNKRNVVYVHDELTQKYMIQYITKNVAHPDYIFMENRARNNNNTPVRMYRNVYVPYYRDTKAAMHLIGLEAKDFATHDYRRCYARRVWTRYKDIQVLQDLLNHADPSTTMRYLKGSGLKNIDYHKAMQG